MSRSVATVDPAAVDRLRRLGGQEFLVEMIDLFLENGPTRLEAVRAGLAAGEAREVHRAAHSLKSTAGNLGGRAVQALSQQIETLAAGGGLEGVAPLVTELETRFDELRERLEQERNRGA